MSNKTLIILFVFLAFLGVVSAQQFDSGEEQIDPLDEFQHLEASEDKFNYFVGIENPYLESSGYDWLETINVYLDSAKKTNDSLQLRLYDIIKAKIYSDLGDHNKSLTLIRDVYNRKGGFTQSQIEVVLNIFDANYGSLRMYDRQIEVRKEKRELGFSNGITFYDIYSNMGMYRRAMNEYIMAVKGTIDEDDNLRKAGHHNIIGNYLRLDNSIDTAIIEFNKAKAFLDLYINQISVDKTEKEIRESEILEALINGNIGKSMVDMKGYKDAISYLQKSVDKLNEIAPKRESQDILDNTLALAKAHLELNNLRTAKRLLDMDYDAIEIKQTLYRNRLLGSYYGKVGNYEASSSYFKSNDKIADSLKKNEHFILKQQLNTIVGESNLENVMWLAEKQQEDNAEIRDQLGSMQEQKNLIIISLVFTLLGFGGLIYAYLRSIKNQRLIEQHKLTIEDQLKEKESLLREIHHRVKNNLQMVSSLLSLQTKNTKSKSAIVALEEGKSRVKAMALIHQKLYQNEDLSYIEMQGYIESLINSVQSVYKKGGHNITITIDAEGTELDIDRAIPFGLILNELVSNSFKYAFPESDDNGQIYIHLRKNGEQGYFEYSDNGVGLPEEVDERTHSSMGLRLINRLVNQLQSKLNIDRNVEGVRFWFTFA